MGTNFFPLKKLVKSFFLFVGLFYSCTFIQAQQGNNPFEITPRLSSIAITNTDSASTVSTGNPFEIVVPQAGESMEQVAVAKPIKPKRTISEAGAYRRFLFISIMSTLLLLTLLMTFFRAFYQKSYSAFGSDNMFNQVFRERESVGLLPFLFLYVLFFFNAGLFIYLLLHYYKISLPAGHLLSWLYCTAAVAVAFTIKHLILSFIGATFPIEKEVRLYNFLIIVFSIITGLVLAPVNVLLAYGPENITQYLLYLTLGTLAVAYLFRYLRGLVIANRFVTSHKFHFLLYICTVEIAPVLFLVKLILNQI